MFPLDVPIQIVFPWGGHSTPLNWAREFRYRSVYQALAAVLCCSLVPFPVLHAVLTVVKGCLANRTNDLVMCSDVLTLYLSASS